MYYGIQERIWTDLVLDLGSGLQLEHLAAQPRADGIL
jgi:hypothetical protein